MHRMLVAALGAASLLAGGPAVAQEIFVGNLVDYTGATSSTGKWNGLGKDDALKYAAKNGGINGKTLSFETFDYSYQAPRSVAQYKAWKQRGAVAIQGYGTADTEAMVGFVSEDKIPYISMSFSGHLTDPTGKGPKTQKPTPYNFFFAPSYSDGVRALVEWAAEDWKKKGGSGAPKYVHMGDNHPYPNAPKAAGEARAKELGFQVLNPIQYALGGGDFKAQCLALKESGANYAFLANTTGSNVALLRSCETVGVDVQFLANIWGLDEAGMKAAGKAANNIVWVLGAPPWGADVPGMKTVREVAKMSDPELKDYKALPYMLGVCHVFFMVDAMKWADKNGGVTGENIKKAMYARKEWVPEGMEGVCGPATLTPEDHRSVTTVSLYRSQVTGPTESGSIAELMQAGTMGMQKIATIEVPRRPDWLGW